MAVEPNARALDDRSLYINREISWLGFNERVLGQALSPRWPLLDRLKVLAIFASDLDEFFVIRVSALHEPLEAPVIEASRPARRWRRGGIGEGRSRAPLGNRRSKTSAASG